jgi:hypothetical protein
MIILKDLQKETNKLLSSLPRGTIFRLGSALGMKVKLNDFEEVKAITIKGDNYWDEDDFEVDEIITDINQLEIK